MFLQLFIISRSGGLIYNQDLSEAAPHLTTNDWLRFGSTFHGLHAIAGQIAPIISGGIEKLETGTFKLQCFQSLTGVKFVLTAEANTPDMDTVLQKVYEAYADYVLKNPFYELDMPIRVELFSQAVNKITAQYSASKSRRT
jgi:trafficking protein particle complex subunit 4